MSVLRRVLDASPSADNLLTTEWLVANGLGGYAAGTLAGAATRRYHGLLVAALPPPLGRTMMLNHVSEELTLADGTRAPLNAVERADRALALPGADRLASFALEDGLPVWRFRAGGALLEKRVWMSHGANVSFTRYRLLEGETPVRLTLTPGVSFRGHDEPVTSESGADLGVRTVAGGVELSSREPLPPLRLSLRSGVGLTPGPLVAAPHAVTRVLYRVEENRGYPAEGV